MSLHVSVETGRAMHQAGWRREFQPGDWFVWQDGSYPHMIQSVTGGGTIWASEPDYKAYSWHPQDRPFMVHLPRLGDLLVWLAARLPHGVDMDYCKGRWFVCYWTGEPGVGPSDYYEHEQAVEAAAQAVLAMLRQEGSK